MAHTTLITAASVCAVGLSACTTPAPQYPGWDLVKVSKQAPADGCRAVGEVRGVGAGGGLTSPEEKTEAAFNALRNEAAARSGNFVRLESVEVNPASHTLSGSAFLCGEAVAEKPPPEAPTAVAVAAPVAPVAEQAVIAIASEAESARVPQGLAGFHFGDTLEQSSDTCVNAGLTWTRHRDVSQCSDQPVSLGAPGAMEIATCGGQVCVVSARIAPAEAQFAAVFAHLQQRVEERYGASQSKVDTLSTCTGSVSACLAEEGSRRAEWYFPSGQAIELTAVPGPTSSAPPAILIRYSQRKEPPRLLVADPTLPGQ